MKKVRWKLILLSSLVLHVLFNWIGYNPTDDGFVLAISRRLLNGEFPHRDFISIRPVGSSLLHLPVLLFGDYCLWISRYIVLVQYLVITNISLLFIQKRIPNPLSLYEEYFWLLVIFVCCIHQAPPLAWTTIDGIFLSAIGFYLVYSERKWTILCGLLFIGLAALTKQVFLPLLFIPLVLSLNIGFGLRLLTFLPALLYVFVVALNGGLSSMIVQFTARGEFLETGVLSYLKPATCLGIIYALCVPLVLKNKHSFIKIGYLFLPVLGYAIVGLGSPAHLYGYTFLPFGIASALFVYSIIRKEYHITQLLLVVLAIAWTASISLGYNFPIYFSGVVLCCNIFIIRYWTNTFEISPKYYAVILFLILPMFLYLRLFHPYRDAPAFDLKYPLTGVMKGAQLIKTNANTYGYINEINAFADKAHLEQKRIAIIPSFPGYWIQSTQPNPIPVDWANHYEAQGPLFDSVCNTIQQHKSGLWILIDKFETKSFATGLVPLKNEYDLVDYVFRNGVCIHSGQYVDVYELK